MRQLKYKHKIAAFLPDILILGYSSVSGLSTLHPITLSTV